MSEESRTRDGAPCCPFCRSEKVTPSGSGFVEQGEWNGHRYEQEEDVSRYTCTACAINFWVTP